MAIVFAPDRNAAQADIQSFGSVLGLVGTLTFSGSYSTGGESVDLEALVKRIGAGRVLAILGSARGNQLEYDSTNDKIKVWASANTEHAAAAYNAALTASAIRVVVLAV